MNKKTVCALILTMAVVAIGQIIAPPISIYESSISFDTNGSAPVLSGPPRINESVGVFLASTPNKRIVSLAVSGDSLLISTGTDTSSLIIYLPYYANTVTFAKAGVYKAYEINTEIMCFAPGCNISPLGEFRILPLLILTPSMPMAGTAATLELIPGGMRPDCYVTMARVQGDSIYLSWDFLNLDPGICLMDTVLSFNLGTLGAGGYTVVMEDSITVGTFTVQDIMVVNGSVTVMQHPLINALPRPVGNASVIAVRAEECPDFWYRLDYASTPDTFRTTTDSSGHFTLNLPYAQVDFKISVEKGGYFSQSLYTSQYAVLESAPPVMALSFELLDTANTPAVAELNTVATLNGSPAESVYVSFDAGREPLVCPLLLKEPLAKTADIAHSYGGYTDRNGQLSLSDMSLDPYIDYAYYAYRYTGGHSYSRQGVVRLNWFMPQALAIDLWTTGTEERPENTGREGITAVPNPFNPSVTISFNNPGHKADVRIYNLQGKLVHSFSKVAGENVTWNATGFSSGIYIVRATIGSQAYAKKVFLQK